VADAGEYRPPAAARSPTSAGSGKCTHRRSRTSLLQVRDRYGDIPLYITENGAAFYDPPTPIDGGIEDPLREHYLREHLRAAHDAIRQGVDLRGYYVWSLLDNYEWSAGYAPVRHRACRLRHAGATPKRSARFYADVIRTHGAAALSETHNAGPHPGPA
jgi:beta-glucosidase